MSFFYYDKTKYPRIYKDCYWGNFEYDSSRNLNDDHIYENRNNFIENHNIKKYKGYRIPIKLKNVIKIIENDIQKKYSLHIDHIEIYETIEKDIIYLTSPYQKLEDKDEKLLLDNTKFTKNRPLYSSGATSYYTIFQKCGRSFINI